MSKEYKMYLDGKFLFGGETISGTEVFPIHETGEGPKPLFKIKLEDGREFDVIDVRETDTWYIFTSYLFQMKIDKRYMKVTKEFEEFIEKVGRKR
ncbi:hypothetical protein K7T73_12590 [Bacillus badius]|uniref:hypothetical protein n=1 Tax=Bacillus badius TaxID=1455 RepID=UPI001CBD2901|nr:hypothetical protein [Bacillus badius]UAT29438.1 hypothetical protein K7T73_12590 [Bacillus badius]